MIPYFFKKHVTTSGMTLVEVLVSLSIVVVVMIAVGTFQFNIISYNRSTQVRLTNVQEASNIVKVMAKELRAMAPSANGSYAIESAGTSTIIFFTDTNGDAIPERVRYYVASTTLYRGLKSPSGSPAVYTGTESIKIVATGIVNSPTTPVFEYYTSAYGGSGTTMTYPLVLTSIRLIRANITLDTDPNKSPVARTFSTQVSLRNLKDNL
jgi:type II secretory pathway pseudopilin PulG